MRRFRVIPSIPEYVKGDYIIVFVVALAIIVAFAFGYTYLLPNNGEAFSSNQPRVNMAVSDSIKEFAGKPQVIKHASMSARKKPSHRHHRRSGVRVRAAHTLAAQAPAVLPSSGVSRSSTSGLTPLQRRWLAQQRAEDASNQREYQSAARWRAQEAKRRRNAIPPPNEMTPTVAEREEIPPPGTTGAIDPVPAPQE